MDKNANLKSMMKRIKELEGSLKIANEYAEKLEAKVRMLEKQKSTLAEEERKKSDSQRRSVLEGREIVMRDALIKNLSSEANFLKKRFSKIREMEMIASDGCVPVAQMEELDREKIIEKDKAIGISNSVVFFKRPGCGQDALKILITLQPKAVIAALDEDAARLLNRADIPVISPKSIRLRRYAEFLGADAAELEREIRKSGRK